MQPLLADVAGTQRGKTGIIRYHQAAFSGYHLKKELVNKDFILFASDFCQRPGSVQADSAH
jgi:hypothetical protein